MSLMSKSLVDWYGFFARMGRTTNSWRYQYVGVSIWLQGYRYFNSGSKQVQVSRNVIFQDPESLDNEYRVPAPLPSLFEGENEAPVQPDSLATPDCIQPLSSPQASSTFLPPSSAHMPTPLCSLLTLTTLSEPDNATSVSPSSQRCASPPRDIPAKRRAPKDISSNIDTENITSGKRQRTQNPDYAMAAMEAQSLSDDPNTMDKA
ncbi:hypothetical protein BDV98DRAFT_604918 [Pterulicium gracile]|uniref:Uncharacterized protein n=1 Tax=Pterulicium gracile TaxID=1884261 RepID=A0A5C3QS03_9AGAR|nr:hypothetical protein BDV98DRAFT_604918 [Pterula gracilis]